jgi:hypothetical protein
VADEEEEACLIDHTSLQYNTFSLIAKKDVFSRLLDMTAGR